MSALAISTSTSITTFLDNQKSDTGFCPTVQWMDAIFSSPLKTIMPTLNMHKCVPKQLQLVESDSANRFTPTHLNFDNSQTVNPCFYGDADFDSNGETTDDDASEDTMEIDQYRTSLTFLQQQQNYHDSLKYNLCTPMTFDLDTECCDETYGYDEATATESERSSIESVFWVNDNQTEITTTLESIPATTETETLPECNWPHQSPSRRRCNSVYAVAERWQLTAADAAELMQNVENSNPNTNWDTCSAYNTSTTLEC